MKSCQENDGFTLVEMLFALGLFSLLSVFMTSTLAAITDWHVYDTNNNSRMEWNIFIRQLELEFEITKDFTVPKSNILVMDKENEKITYEIYNKLVRRRVDDAGHEVVLQNIKSVQFIKENETLTISVMFINGEQYEKRIFKRYKFEPS